MRTGLRQPSAKSGLDGASFEIFFFFSRSNGRGRGGNSDDRFESIFEPFFKIHDHQRHPLPN